MVITNYTKNSDGVFIPDIPVENNFFEKQYHSVRVCEQRIYSDTELAGLPDTASFNKYHREWEIRKKSSARFIEYLKQKNKPLKILDAGCGNGWLSNKLAGISKSETVAMDLNYEELKQASRVFTGNDNLFFVHGNINSFVEAGLTFDIILFSASIQYFSSLTEVIAKSILMLNDDGEIHIIDSPVYKPGKVDAAKERSGKYYRSIGFEKMSDYYFHHSVDDLKNFNSKILYDPDSFKNYFFRNGNPFKWICIYKQNLF